MFIIFFSLIQYLIKIMKHHSICSHSFLSLFAPHQNCQAAWDKGRWKNNSLSSPRLLCILVLSEKQAFLKTYLKKKKGKTVCTVQDSSFELFGWHKQFFHIIHASHKSVTQNVWGVTVTVATPGSKTKKPKTLSEEQNRPTRNFSFGYFGANFHTVFPL